MHAYPDVGWNTKMERLGSMDSAFLDVEKSGPSVAVGSASRVLGKAPTIEELRTFVDGRLEEMPRFRQRVVASRTKMRQSKWVSTRPDLEHHVIQIVLKPGDLIDVAVTQIMERPLDRKRPLWDCTLVTGYSKTEWCCVWRLHHSIADGQGAMILLGRTIDLAPDGGFTLADAIESMSAHSDDGGEKEELPGGFEGLAARTVKAIEAGFEGAGQFLSSYPDTVRTLVNLAPRRATDLTGPVSAQRKWVSGQYSLADVKDARKSLKGVTINDIVLAGVTAGFRALIESRGHDPAGRTVRAVMPISLRTNMDSNNQVGILPAPLPVGETDPLKRIKLIKQATKHSKRSMLPIIADKAIKMTEKVTPAPLQELVLSHSGQSTQYFSETLVTNVPGPMVPMYFMGQEILSNTPIIPIEGTMRIIVGITSYLGQLNIGVTGDGEHAPDVDVLMAGIIDGLDEIVRLGGVEPGAAAAKAEAS